MVNLLDKRKARTISGGDVLLTRQGETVIVAKRTTQADGSILFYDLDGNQYSHREVSYVPSRYVPYNAVFGYDFASNKWVFDAKFYLRNGFWYRSYEKPVVMRACSQDDIDTIRRIVENHPGDIFSLKDVFIPTLPSENSGEVT